MIATAGFLVFRLLMGFEPLDVTFAKYWARTPGIPGQDLLTAMNTLFLGGEARAGQVPLLWVDFVAVTGMLASIPFVFRRLGASFGLYSVGILFFLLLATSDVLPLYSVARYVLPISSVWRSSRGGFSRAVFRSYPCLCGCCSAGFSSLETGWAEAE